VAAVPAELALRDRLALRNAHRRRSIARVAYLAPRGAIGAMNVAVSAVFRFFPETAEDHLAGSCLQHTRHCDVGILTDQTACIINHHHRAIVEIGHALIVFLTFLQDENPIASPGSTTGLSAFASSLILSTLTPRNWETLFRLKSFVTITASSCLPSSISFRSTSRTDGKSVSTIWMSSVLLFCKRFSMSRPRLPRWRLDESGESATCCNSRRMNCGMINDPVRNPVSATSAIRPSIITDVSRIFRSRRATLSLKIPPSAERSR